MKIIKVNSQKQAAAALRTTDAEVAVIPHKRPWLLVFKNEKLREKAQRTLHGSLAMDVEEFPSIHSFAKNIMKRLGGAPC